MCCRKERRGRVFFGFNVSDGEIDSKRSQKIEEVETMKKNPKIFFHPIDGSAPLSIYWYVGPYGDALESKELNGIYFLAPNGELLGVQFDDVNEAQDEQMMTIKSGTKISIKVNSGKIKVKVDIKSKNVA